MATWARRKLFGALAGFASCAATGSCACYWNTKTGKGYKGCPCKKGKECESNRCMKSVCR
ncbi:MAG: hypothetical protein ACR2J8_15270 [Thermomicrobiales bacterium]